MILPCVNEKWNHSIEVDKMGRKKTSAALQGRGRFLLQCRRKARNLIGDSAELTRLLHALETADTIRLVGAFIKSDTHGTVIVAFLAENAFIGMMDHPENADLVEKRIDGAQGANDPAERATYEYHERQEDQEDPNLARIEPPDKLSQLRLQEQHGDSRLKGPGRADILAEPGYPVAESVDDQKGQQNHKNRQEHVLDVDHPVGEFDLPGRDLVDQFLEETEGTQPSAGHPAHQAPNNPQDSEDVQADMGIARLGARPDGGKHRLKRTQGTGAGRCRAGITVQSGNADRLQFSLIDVSGKGEEEIGVAESGRRRLYPPS